MRAKDVSAARFTEAMNTLIDRSVARYAPWVETRLNAEGTRAALAYERAGEAAAIAEVKDATYRVILDRVWLSVTPRAGELVSEMLAKAAEDIFVESAIRWLRLNAGKRIEGMTETSRREIGNQIRIGVSKGETRQQIADRIVKTRRSVSPERALTIAQTEVHAAANYGSLVAAGEDRSPLKKIWRALAGARPTHAAAHGQEQPLSEPFQVGAARLEYPGAPGPPEETINCRCSMVYKEAAVRRRPRRRPAA